MNRNETMTMLGVLKMLDRQNRVTLDDITIDIWASLLDDIPAPAAMEAVKHYMRTAKWFPAPSEIRDLVYQRVCGIPTEEEARKQIERSMRENYPGMPAKYTPDQIVLDAVREIGGVHVFRVSQSERETADLWKRFTAKYQDIRAERMETTNIAAEWEQRQGLSGGSPNGQHAALEGSVRS